MGRKRGSGSGSPRQGDIGRWGSGSWGILEREVCEDLRGGEARVGLVLRAGGDGLEPLLSEVIESVVALGSDVLDNVVKKG